MEESLARKSLLGTVMNLLGAVIAYAGFFFIARYMPSGDQVIGLVAFSTGYASIFLPVSRLGFMTAHGKKVSSGEDLAECNGAFMIITVLLTLAMIAAVFASVFFWTYLLHRGFQSEEEVYAIWIMLGYTVLTALSSVPITTFNARREVVKGQIGAMAGHVVRVAAIVVVVFAGLARLDIVWAYFLGGAASLVASFFYFRNYPVKRPSRRLLREYTKFANPLLVPSLLSPLPVNIAPVIVQLFWSLQITGYFGSAYRIITVLSVLALSVTNVIFPKLSELHSQGKSLEIKKRTAEAEKLLGFILAPLTIFMVIYADGVIHVLLKNTFLGASASMAILSLFIYVNGISSPKVSLLPALNRPGTSGRISAASSIISLALMVVLVPTSIFGVKLFALRDYGASIALLVSAVFTYGASHFFSYRYAGTRFEYRVIAYPAAGLLSALAVMPLTAYFPVLGWSWYIGLLFALLSIGIYTAICLLTRLIGTDELKLLIESVNPFAMHHYVRSELSADIPEGKK